VLYWVSSANRAGSLRKAVPHVRLKDFVLGSAILLVAVVLGRSLAQGDVLSPSSAPVLAGLVAFATVLRKDLGARRVSTS
jgi:hypothetical protein